MSVRPRSTKPFLLDGGDTGCLLLHGFSGSPAEMEPMGRFLAQHGLTVYCPVLAGHDDAARMESAGWREWRETALTAMSEMRARTARLFVAGFSLGGLIGFDLAASEQVAGVISINTPIRLRSKQVLRAHLVSHVQQAAASDIVPDRVPMSCVSSLYDYTRRVETLLPIVTAPALVIQARDDEVIDPGDAKQIHDALGSKCKRIVWIDEASHLVVLDRKRVQVFTEVQMFIEESARSDGLGDDLELDQQRPGARDHEATPHQ